LRVALVVGLGLLLGRLGPFGTFAEVEPAPRYAYWIGLTLLMWLQCLAALVVLDTIGRPANRFAQAGAAGLIGAVPTAFEVAWAEMLIRVERDLGLIDVAMIYGDVALLAVPLMITAHGLLPSSQGKTQATAAVPTGSDWLIARLRPDRRGRLLALESEDHYVRVRTSAGDELLHMRFGDAIDRLGPDLGSRVHRGWWVARDAVRRQRRDGDRVIVELLDGTEVPISRTYLLSARKAGLIASG
jgi:hypothetical protein